jgi:hypothetical protein
MANEIYIFNRRRCYLFEFPSDLFFPSPLMGEVEDEGENLRFDMPWQVVPLIGRNKG